MTCCMSTNSRIIIKDNGNGAMDGAMMPTPLPPPATPAHNQNNHGMRFMTSIARYDPQIVMHGPNKHGLRKVFLF